MSGGVSIAEDSQTDRTQEQLRQAPANPLKNCIQSYPRLFFTFIAEVVQEAITAARNSESVDVLSIVTNCAATNFGHNLDTDLKELLENKMTNDEY